MDGSRSARAIAAASLTALLLTGCGGDDERAGTTATTPTTRTTPGTTYAPPAVRSNEGYGAQIGARVRVRHAETTFGSLPPGFAPGGIAIGARAGLCEVPEVTDDDLFELEAAAGDQTPDARVGALTPADVLIANCGSSGRWAMIAWEAESPDGQISVWIDELRDAGAHWDGTARGVYPGCRVPLAAAAVWRLDVTRCPPSARRPPSEPPPPRPPSPSRLSEDGSSRA